MPIGTIISSYSQNAPLSYLLCDGSTYDIIEYPDLYLLLNTNVLPDLRDKVLKYNSTTAIGSFENAQVGEFTLN